MKTKIGLPFGLALVMFIGVFTTMLALGALSPSRAQAVTGDFDVMLSNYNLGHYSDWSFSVMSSEDFVGADAITDADDPVTTDTLDITFPDDVALTGAGVEIESNWMLGGKPIETAQVSGQVVMLTPQAAAAATDDDPAVPPFKIDAGDPIKVEFTAPMKGSTATGDSAGIQNPDTTVAAADRTNLTISVVTTDDTTAGVSKMFSFDNTRLGEVMVTNSPSGPGSQAQYQITFYTGEQLDEGTSRIFLEIDSSVGVPTSLSPQDVRISTDTVGTPANDPASSPNQSRPLDLAPTYQVLPGTDNRKLYTIPVPDMDAAEARNTGIGAGAMVTLTLLANSGFTNPTEAGTDDFTVSTTESTTGVKATFTTGVLLFSDDKADNRDKPLTVTGRGFKNGTTATVYLDRNDNGIKDLGDVDLVSVPVAADDTFEATFNVTVPPFKPGPDNMINAVDGETPPNTAEMGVPFEVEGLLSVSPATLGVGDTLSIDLKDWLNEQVTKVEIGGVNHTPASRPTVANNRLQFDSETP